MSFNTASTYNDVYVSPKGAMSDEEMRAARDKRRELMDRMKKG